YKVPAPKKSASGTSTEGEARPSQKMRNRALPKSMARSRGALNSRPRTTNLPSGNDNPLFESSWKTPSRECAPLGARSDPAFASNEITCGDGAELVVQERRECERGMPSTN